MSPVEVATQALTKIEEHEKGCNLFRQLAFMALSVILGALGWLLTQEHSMMRDQQALMVQVQLLHEDVRAIKQEVRSVERNEQGENTRR